MTKTYFAVVEIDNQPGFSVFFPDVPGCASAGDTLEEACRNAREALELHLQGMLEDHQPLPAPSAPPVKVDKDVQAAYVVPVEFEVPVRNRRVNVILPEDLLKGIDEVANNRSGFLADAAYQRLYDEYKRKGLKPPAWLKTHLQKSA